MPLAHLHFWGSAIQRITEMHVLLPDTGTPPFPVLYLLHGLSDNHAGLLRFTALERHLFGIPLMVVIPSCHRQWWTNSASNPIDAFEDHLVKDVIKFVEYWFPAIKSRNARAIGGLSMGGFGAIKTALKYPEMFRAATSHSGPLMTPLWNPESCKELSERKAECELILGRDCIGGPNDLVALAKKCPKEKRPALHFDCGKDDFLIEQNREFHKVLTDLDFPHQYVENPGAHQWVYWDTHIPDAIAFHCKQLGVKMPESIRY